MDIRERFFSKTVPDASGCLLWNASVNHAGYGQFMIWSEGRKPYLAHRVAWRLEHGAWPSAQLLHTCDNPRCVNVSHLREGTQRENIDDMMAKQRSSRGKSFAARRHENHGMAKLTWEIVNAMRARYSQGGISMAAVGREFGIGRHQAQNIIKQKHWVSQGYKA